MLDSIKQILALKSVDSHILASNYDLALEKLNYLIRSGYRPDETRYRRGKLFRLLLMSDEAYSDLTYVIKHYPHFLEAFRERMRLNYEISNFKEAVSDTDCILSEEPENKEAQRIKFLSLVFSSCMEKAKDFVYYICKNNKYRAVQILLNTTAEMISIDELAKALKILEIIDIIDKDNPIKLLKEANIYALAGEEDKQKEVLQKIDSVFPKYFISHFKFGDIFESRDLLEISFLLELKIFDKQNLFAYPMAILEGYKDNLEGHITDSKTCFEKAIEINPNKPEAYVLLGQTFQLLSGFDNPEYKKEAQLNYQKALELYESSNIVTKAEDMKRQIRHLNSSITFEKV